MRPRLGPPPAFFHLPFFLLLGGTLPAVASSACDTGGGYALPPPRTPNGVPGPGGPALHDEALRELASVKATAYDHKVTIDESAGLYRFDCSGFVDYAIRNVAPDAFDALRLAMHRRRPTARSYVDFLDAIPAGEARGRWMHLAAVADLRPGDLVAWLATTTKPDAWDIVNTGHVMIADGAATERAPGEWVVPVIDSSFGHGGADPRAWPGATGLGRGTIVLVLEDGAVAGYRWTESPRSKAQRTTVALGRVL